MPKALGWKTLPRNGDIEGDSDGVSVWVLVEWTDPPINTESDQHRDFHRGWSQHRRFVDMRFKKTLNMVVPTAKTTMAHNSDEEEMVPDGLVEVTGLIEATLDGLQAGANSYTAYGLVVGDHSPCKVKSAESREKTRQILKSLQKGKTEQTHCCHRGWIQHRRFLRHAFNYLLENCRAD